MAAQKLAHRGRPEAAELGVAGLHVDAVGETENHLDRERLLARVGEREVPDELHQGDLMCRFQAVAAGGEIGEPQLRAEYAGSGCPALGGEGLLPLARVIHVTTILRLRRRLSVCSEQSHVEPAGGAPHVVDDASQNGQVVVRAGTPRRHMVPTSLKDQRPARGTRVPRRASSDGGTVGGERGGPLVPVGGVAHGEPGRVRTAADRAGVLLDRVCQFVGEQCVSAGRRRVVLAVSEKDVTPCGECACPERARQGGGLGVAVQSDVPQVQSQVRLRLGTDVLRQRLPAAQLSANPFCRLLAGIVLCRSFPREQPGCHRVATCRRKPRGGCDGDRPRAERAGWAAQLRRGHVRRGEASPAEGSCHGAHRMHSAPNETSAFALSAGCVRPCLLDRTEDT
jgi:hypothetical protein